MKKQIVLCCFIVCVGSSFLPKEASHYSFHKPQTMVHFAYTILYVKDVTKSITFYEQAFGLQRKFIAPGNEYGELITGNTALAFAATSLANKNLPNGFIESDANNKPFGIEIGFATDNVEEMVNAAVSAGAILVEKPKTKPWGQTVAYVRDEDGFLIEICTPVG